MVKSKISKNPATKALIGFIGQGFIGKNYADDFENRGYDVIRYALQSDYSANRDKIKDCDIVFIAVPTPTTPKGFDDSIIHKVINLVGKGKIAVIKSTIVPGTTESIQKENPDIFVMHSPEFLTEKTAAYDAAHPARNIVGLPVENQIYKKKAELVISVLPKAPYSNICRAKEAELVKYGGNCWFYFKVIFMNMLYDVSKELNCDFEVIRCGMAADPRIGSTHLNPVHQGGRGAGGHCFIKDFAAFSEFYNKYVGDKLGREVLESLTEKNIDLLLGSGKDINLLKGVYGEKMRLRKK